jgi:hypothetical protein
MTDWVLLLRRTQASGLARLLDAPDVEVAELADLLWVRGRGSEEDVARVRSLLPGGRFFELLEPDRLRPPGRLVPTARLPEARYRPLRSWLSLSLPPVALCGETSRTVGLRLVPGRGPRGEELLLAHADRFRDFLSQAPSFRIAPLRFAVNGESEVLVRGTPLPSIAGERFVSCGGIAVAAGWTWTPALGVPVLRSWLGLAPGTLALWRADATIAEVSLSSFAPANRRVRHAI